MKRSAFVPAAVLLLCAVTPALFAQAKPAPVAAPAPTDKAKWVAPVKGVANVEVIRGPSKRVGKELVTTMTVKNTSTGSISLLKVDELWYDKKRAVVTSATAYYRKPFLPNEVITIELKAPILGEPDVDQISFAHANGRVEVKPVKKFSQ